MLKRKRTMASDKLVVIKSVRRTRGHRMKFCVQRGLGGIPNKQRREPNGYPGALLASFFLEMKEASEETIKFHSPA